MSSTSIYSDFVFHDRIISPKNGKSYKKITKQNIKFFGFESIDELHTLYPNFPLRCQQYCDLHKEKMSTASSIEVTARKIISNKNAYLNAPNKCKQCFTVLDYDQRSNKFCSKSCSAKFNNTNRDPKVYEKQKQTLYKTNLNKPKPSKKAVVMHLLTCKVCNTQFSHSNREVKACSPECRTQIYRNTAIRNRLGGNKNTRAYGWYESPIAGRVWLESSYELIIARILDQSNIKWQRPKYIPYTINSISKKYYPDFYLVDHDIYLDPKNDYLIEQDKTKIDLVCEQNNVRVYVLNKNQLTLEHISSLFR